MTIAGTLISSAREYRGVSGRALAQQAGTSQPTLVAIERGRTDVTSERLDRLLRPLGYRLTALPTRLGTAADCAERVGLRLAQGDVANAERTVLQFAADLQHADLPLRVALCITPPASSGDPRFDAYIAAVVEWSLSEYALLRPQWLDDPSRSLAIPWDIERVPVLQAEARRVTPDAFIRHGVYLDPINLVDA